MVGLVGSYRKDSTVDRAVSAVLAAAVEAGATTEKIYLVDEQIEFCRNCRHCMQEPGEERGQCVMEDAVPRLLEKLEAADGLVLGAPTNFGDVTAITRRFLERTVCYAFWPWEKAAPRLRRSTITRRAVLVTSSAAPAILGRPFFRAWRRSKKWRAARARTIGTLYIGMAGRKDVDLAPHAGQGRAAGEEAGAGQVM